MARSAKEPALLRRQPHRLREHIKDESVDLIYLEPALQQPPGLHVLFAEKSLPERESKGRHRSSSQIMAFEDTWEWNMDAEAAYEESSSVAAASPTPCAPSAPSSANRDMMAYSP